jgi:AraC-like DNA-binding protein
VLADVADSVAERMQMDTLSEVLKSVRLAGATFFSAEFRAPWGFTSPPVGELASLLSLGAGQVVLYHLVTEGRATARLTDGAEIALEAGDVVIIPHGDAHSVWNGRPANWHNMVPDAQRALAGDLQVSRAGGNGEVTRFVCGYFGCEKPAGHLLLSGLPRILRIRLRGAVEGDWIETAIHYLGADGPSGGAGRLALLAKLSEALFVETLRRYMLGLPEEETGWWAGARDPITGQALALLHRDPSRPWSVAELAHEVGASRSVLIDRFSHFLGEPPMAYLTRWRLQLGARLLETTSRSVGEIAGDVGYESQAAFNRAFKRQFQMAPGRYRRRTSA